MIFRLSNIIIQGIPNSKWPNDIKDTKGGYAELLAKELKKLKEDIGKNN